MNEQTVIERPMQTEARAKSEEKIIYNSNMKRQEMRAQAELKRNAVLSALLSTILIFSLSICCLFFSNHNKYSENENRYLAKEPKITSVSLLDGRFMKDTDSYFSDHFFARDSFIKLKTYSDIFLGKGEINNIYIGKERFLFEKPSKYDETRVNDTLNKIKNFTNKHKDVKSYMALIPNSSDILFSLMPAGAPNVNQRAQIRYVYGNLSNMNCIDVYSQFMNAPNKKDFYYKTDHHWTTLGAQTAFFEISRNMNLDISGETYKLYPVTNNFQGTLASSSGLFSATDNIYIPTFEPNVDYVADFVNEEEKKATIYDYSKLNHKSKYDVFFGGNFAQINIETNADSNRVLMVIKDSYANCLIPMFIPYYKKIVIVDPRYYFDDIDRLVNKEEVTEILWLYNVNTFLNDASIKDTFE